ncbi:MAG TPA: glycosyltransferase [Myxococcota bacterium]|nr:glycosyltransferase [Myxococcota bacterium]HRY94345.1 glycosyltransferase [Myxococcota bacterium]HSA22100.1 glycosyltransferase [Myxococcota bacterium]
MSQPGRPRLLWLTSSFPQQGRPAGLFLPDLFAELTGRGAAIAVLTQNTAGRRTEREALPCGAEVTRFGWSGGDRPLVSQAEAGWRGLRHVSDYFARGLLAGRRLLATFRPDCLVAEWLVPAGLLALLLARLGRVPFAARALGSDVLVVGRQPLARPLVAWVARSAGVLFADGFDLAAETSRLAGGRPCLFAATARRLGDERSTFRLPEAPGFFTLLTVGRLHPAKGQDVLLEALGRLAARGCPVRAVLVGDGPLRARLEQRAAELGLGPRLVLTGVLPDGDLAALLARVDCVVIPSRSESIPLVLGEAARHRRPLVVSAVGDMATLVRRFELGYDVPAEAPEALAAAIERMRAEPDRARFGRQASALADLLSTPEAARTMLGAIEELLTRGRG